MVAPMCVCLQPAACEMLCMGEALNCSRGRSEGYT